MGFNSGFKGLNLTPKQLNKISEDMDATNLSVLGPVASSSEHGGQL